MKIQLGEIAEIQMGQSPLSSTYNTEGKGLPFYQGITEFGDKYPTKKMYTTNPIKIAEKGDVLFSVRAPVGEVNIAIEKCCIGRGNASLRIRNGNQEYLYYLLKANKKNINYYTSGTVFESISGVELKNIKIEIEPNPEEQKRISNILSSFDNKIEILKKENKILEDIAENIFKEWFVKYNFPNKYGKPYRDSNGKMIDSELGPIPDGWRVGKLGDFGQVICGKTPSTKNASFFGGNYPFIKIPDMTELYVFKTESTLTDLGSKELNGKIVPANSICVSCIATIGKVSITTEDSFTNQQINTIIPNQNIYREYLYFTLNNMQEYLEMIGNRGSTTFNINTEMFRNLEIVTPKEELLDSFSSATANLFEKILVNTKLTINLEIQKDKLLKELVK